MNDNNKHNVETKVSYGLIQDNISIANKEKIRNHVEGVSNNNKKSIDYKKVN